jgi:hypothetical protein
MPQQESFTLAQKQTCEIPSMYLLSWATNLFTHSSCHDPMKEEYHTNMQVPKQQFGGICLSNITEL